jgi:hypothetical protein
LIIRLIIHTILLYPSRAVWIDEASNVSRPDPSGANQIDAEHQATDLAVGGSNPSRRAQRPRSADWGSLFACLLIILRRRVTPSDRLEPVEAHHRTGHQHKGEPSPRVPVPPHLQPPEAAQPRQGTLDLPAVASKPG